MNWSPPDPDNTMEPREAAKLLYRIFKTGERIPKRKYVPLFNAIMHELDLHYSSNKNWKLTMAFEHGECSIFWAVHFTIGKTSYDILFDIYSQHSIITLVNNTRGVRWLWRFQKNNTDTILNR